MITVEQILETEYEAMYLQYYGEMQIAPVAPNPMFSEMDHFLTKFIRPPGAQKWTCAACGKKRGSRWFWTQIVPFRAAYITGAALFFGPALEALTPVCADHPIKTWE